jgi:hypothetical protein
MNEPGHGWPSLMADEWTATRDTLHRRTDGATLEDDPNRLTLRS